MMTMAPTLVESEAKAKIRMKTKSPPSTCMVNWTMTQKTLDLLRREPLGRSPPKVLVMKRIPPIAKVMMTSILGSPLFQLLLLLEQQWDVANSKTKTPTIALPAATTWRRAHFLVICLSRLTLKTTNLTTRQLWLNKNVAIGTLNHPPSLNPTKNRTAVGKMKRQRAIQTVAHQAMSISKTRLVKRTMPDSATFQKRTMPDSATFQLNRASQRLAL